MKAKKNRSSVLLTVLALTMMLLTGCASGPQLHEKSQVTPTGQYLEGLATEYRDGVYGPHTREVVKDWVAQNEPGISE